MAGDIPDARHPAFDQPFLLSQISEGLVEDMLARKKRQMRFLADGTIEMGMIEGKGGVKRYIQILKMRATKHSMEKHQITIGDDGINILGPIY